MKPVTTSHFVLISALSVFPLFGCTPSAQVSQSKPDSVNGEGLPTSGLKLSTAIDLIDASIAADQTLLKSSFSSTQAGACLQLVSSESSHREIRKPIDESSKVYFISVPQVHVFLVGEEFLVPDVGPSSLQGFNNQRTAAMLYQSPLLGLTVRLRHLQDGTASLETFPIDRSLPELNLRKANAEEVFWALEGRIAEYLDSLRGFYKYLLTRIANQGTALKAELPGRPNADNSDILLSPTQLEEARDLVTRMKKFTEINEKCKPLYSIWIETLELVGNSESAFIVNLIDKLNSPGSVLKSYEREYLIELLLGKKK